MWYSEAMYKPIFTKYPIPQPGDPGAFGTVRKFDVHTGIDLYAEQFDPVFAVEAGTVVRVEKFTGPEAGSPWWNNTWAVLIEGESGVIVYGEIIHAFWIHEGYKVAEGERIGQVCRVLKKDKGVTPTTMLHFELMKHGTRETFWWRHGDDQPEALLDPTELVRKLYEQ
jgi:murein DD-endopeptidase MepM/ murein hydrolase activator NlpD